MENYRREKFKEWWDRELKEIVTRHLERMLKYYQGIFIAWLYFEDFQQMAEWMADRLKETLRRAYKRYFELMLDEEFMSIAEVARLLHVSHITVRKLIKEQKLKAIQVGRTYLVSWTALEDFIRKGGQIDV